MKLTGKVTWVTNVSQYMGPACVEEFAKEGAVLALHERRIRPFLDDRIAGKVSRQPGKRLLGLRNPLLERLERFLMLGLLARG